MDDELVMVYVLFENGVDFEFVFRVLFDNEELFWVVLVYGVFLFS